MSDKSSQDAPDGYGPPDEAMTYEETPEEAGRGRMVLALAVVMAVAAVAILYVVFQHGLREGGRNATPVIVAETNSEKVKPEDPGGLEVPHQDKLVYDRVSGETSERVEKLLPEPEEPVDLSGLRTTPEEGSDVEIETIKTDDTEPEPARVEPIVVEPPKQESPPVKAETKPTPPVTPQAKPEPKPDDAKVIDEPNDIGDLIKSLPNDGSADIGTAVADVDSGAVERASGSIAPATSGAYVVQVASVPEAEAATRMWENLVRKHQGLLAQLRPDIQMADLGAKGVYYRLRVGPFATKADAQNLCSQLKARGQDCLIRKT